MTGIYNPRTGWVVSIVVHLLLVLAFIATKLDLKPFDLDFTPVTFAPISEELEGSGASSEKWGGAKPLVDLPQRPMLEETSPLLKLPESTRQAVIAPSDLGKPDISKIETLRPGKRVNPKSLVSGKPERAPMKPIPLSDKELFGKRSDVIGKEIAQHEAFTIEWKGLARFKSTGELPEYPPNVNREAIVRLSFTVSPGGGVILVKPVTKGEPELEKVAISALRSWRFNRLDEAETQNNQQGVITFRFLLE